MQLSKMQNEYIVNATHRWNIKSGAVRSGKSFVDTAFVIPFRIRERAGKPGLNVILGVSKESIERNVLQPMREIYTDKLVGNINNRNIARVCGEDVYCLGAEKVSQVAKIQVRASNTATGMRSPSGTKKCSRCSNHDSISLTAALTGHATRSILPTG